MNIREADHPQTSLVPSLVHESLGTRLSSDLTVVLRMASVGFVVMVTTHGADSGSLLLDAIFPGHFVPCDHLRIHVIGGQRSLRILYHVTILGRNWTVSGFSVGSYINEENQLPVTNLSSENNLPTSQLNASVVIRVRVKRCEHCYS